MPLIAKDRWLSGGTKSISRVAIGLLAGTLVYVAAERVIFGSGWYSRFLAPDSLGGAVRLMLSEEARRPQSTAPVVAVVGNSVIAEGFSAKVANQAAGGRLRFVSLAVPATTPRCWYYFLRAADPNRDRYNVVVIQVDSIADQDGFEPLPDQISDLHAVDALLGLGDTFDFAFSFHRPRLRFEALRAALLKGYIFKNDVQALLEHPAARLAQEDLYYRGHAEWVSEYKGHPESLEGLAIDWEHRSIHFPSNVPADAAAEIRQVAFRGWPPYNGVQTEYRRRWLGRILERYRGTRTRVIFARVPRSPVVSPGSDPPDAPSFVRDLALPAGTFSFLEKPEYFWDAYHMNARGRVLFSRRLAEELAR